MNPLKKRTESNCSGSSDLATWWKAPLNRRFLQRLIHILHKVLTPGSSLISSPCNTNTLSRLHPSGGNAQYRTEDNTATRGKHYKVQGSNLQDSRPCSDGGSVVHSQELLHPRMAEAEKMTLPSPFLGTKLDSNSSPQKNDFSWISNTRDSSRMYDCSSLSLPLSLTQIRKVCFPSKRFESSSHIAHIQVWLQNPGDDDVTSDI